MFKKTKLLVFVGPDGSGKTTIIENLRSKLVPRYDVEVNHIRFNKIPRVGDLKFFLSRLLRFKFEKRITKTVSNLHEPVEIYVYGPLFPLWKIMPLLCYEILDYVAAYFVLYKRKSKNLKSSVLMFDRYFYDFYTEKDWSNTPSWLMQLLCALAPEPDFIFFMKNTPEEINKRKNELSIDDIAFVNGRTIKLLGGKRNFFSLDTNNSPDEIAETILSIADLKITND
jgi:thymidylate kinase